MAAQTGKRKSSVRKPEDLASIQARRDIVLDRYQQFKNAAQQRRAKLEQAKQLQQFRRDADELEAWIKEKVQIASDEAYKDRRNLQVRRHPQDARTCPNGCGSELYSSFPTQVKIQKHLAFEAEIAAHNHSILSLKAKGLEMIQKDHFAAESIKV